MQVVHLDSWDLLIDLLKAHCIPPRDSFIISKYDRQTKLQVKKPAQKSELIFITD